MISQRPGTTRAGTQATETILARATGKPNIHPTPHTHENLRACLVTTHGPGHLISSTDE